MAEYIEREAAVHLLMNRGRYLTKDLVMDAAYEVSKIPAADVAPVVRCKDCKHITPVEGGLPLCTLHNIARAYNDFCSDGAGRTEQGVCILQTTV